jgi:hypothetical protein
MQLATDSIPDVVKIKKPVLLVQSVPRGHTSIVPGKEKLP